MNNNLDGWAISTELFDWIKDNLTVGSTILELGSGTGTIELTKWYNVYSIENNEAFLNLAPQSTYLHAPLRQYSNYIWYDEKMVEDFIHSIDYDLILVDAPEGKYGRNGFIHNLHLFNLDVPIIIDDTNREQEREIANFLINTFNKIAVIINENPEKEATIIL